MRLVRVDFRDDAAVPDGLDEVVLADDAVPIFDQVDQQVEHLRLDANHLAGPGQLTQPRIQHVLGKVKLHVFAPQTRTSRFLKKGSGTVAQALPTETTCKKPGDKANFVLISF